MCCTWFWAVRSDRYRRRHQSGGKCPADDGCGPQDIATVPRATVDPAVDRLAQGRRHRSDVATGGQVPRQLDDEEGGRCQPLADGFEASEPFTVRIDALAAGEQVRGAQRSQHPQPGPERRRAQVLRRRAPGRQESTCPGIGYQRSGQARLAYARFAAHKHQATLTTGGLVEPAGKDRPLTPAPHQLVLHHSPC
jgi:hypothetical protein